MPTERDIDRLAQQLIARHADRAAQMALLRATHLAARGDVDAAAIWHRVVDAIRRRDP